MYFGHVATSAPSRSGTTHLTFETILQGEGWDKGWNQILQIAGNCAAVTERSFGVPDGVQNGQYGIGLVIDFFGLAAKASGFPVEFAYPSVTAIVPANIGAGRRLEEPGGAASASCSSRCREEGQQLLLDPKISRLPVLPATYAKAPAGYPNPFSGTIQAKVNFDTDLSESRYYVVSSLFDQVITFRHKELQAATKAIQDAEKRLARPRQRAARRGEEARLVAAARRRAGQGQGAARRLQGEEGRRRRAAPARRQVEEEWSSKAQGQLARAVELAKRREMIGRRGRAARSRPSSRSSSRSRSQRVLRRVRQRGGGFTLAHFADASSRSR